MNFCNKTHFLLNLCLVEHLEFVQCCHCLLHHTVTAKCFLCIHAELLVYSIKVYMCCFKLRCYLYILIDLDFACKYENVLVCPCCCCYSADSYYVVVVID